MIKGIIPALVTPFDENGINFEEAKKLFDYTLSNGVSGLFIMGTNGEFYTIEHDEALEYTRKTMAYIGDKAPVFVGLGSNSTQSTINLGLKLKEAGAKYFTVITPYFQALTQQELIDYYLDVANALKTPILLYNIPARTNINVEPETLKVLAENPYIIGIKDSSGNMDNLKGYLDAVNGKDFSVLCGSDSKILSALKLGASGAVASTSNLIPQVIVGIYNSFINNNLEDAQMYQEKLEKLRLTMKIAGVPAVLKKSLSLIGINVGNPRKPVKPVNDIEKINAIKEMLNYYSLNIK